MAHCEGRVAAKEMERRTLLDIRYKLGHVLGPHGMPEVLLPDITFAAADAMRMKLIADGLSAATAAKVLGTLRTMLNWAVDSRLVVRNDLAGRKARRNHREKPQVPIPAAADVARLLDASDALPEPYGLYVRMAVLTGCRAGELRGLQWRHVDFSLAMMQIVQRAEQNGEIGQPKTASGHRIVPLPAGLLRLLTHPGLAVPPPGPTVRRDIIATGFGGQQCFF